MEFDQNQLNILNSNRASLAWIAIHLHYRGHNKLKNSIIIVNLYKDKGIKIRALKQWRTREIESWRSGE